MTTVDLKSQIKSIWAWQIQITWSSIPNFCIMLYNREHEVPLYSWPLFSLDLESMYKSLYFGPLLIVWRYEDNEVYDISFDWKPL